MLIDCDTCTVRGQGCDDCVVTVLLGAPPDWRGSDPTVVPLARRGGPEALHRRSPASAGGEGGGVRAGGPHATEASRDAPDRHLDASDVCHVDSAHADRRPVLELDDVERRAVRALADFGLVPPLRHQDALTPGDRHVS